MKMLPAILVLATLALASPALAADWKEGSTVRIATEGATADGTLSQLPRKWFGFDLSPKE